MRTVTLLPGLCRGSSTAFQLVALLLFGLAAVVGAQTPVNGRVEDASGQGVAEVTVSLGSGFSAVTDAAGDYTIVDVPAGEYEAMATAAGYVFLPTARVVAVPDGANGVTFTATATGTGIPIPGASAIYLAGRDDVGIPAVGADLTGSDFPLLRACSGSCLGFVQEQGPWSTPTLAAEQFQFSAWGGVDYYGGTLTVAGPDGYPEFLSAVDSLAGISAYNGPAGSLVGVFLDDLNPGALAAPEALDFSGPGLGTTFAVLEPGLGQVFFIGDGKGADGVAQTFTAPAGATRLCLGIADAGSFGGAPGFYDDNQGAFVVHVQRLGATVRGSIADLGGALAGVTVSLGAGLTGVTDANGMYQIAGVPSGTYTATASLAGYIFMPPQRLLTVPPDVTGVDFMAYSTAGGTVIPGSTAVYLAGRTDVTIPDLGVDPAAVGFPLGRNCTAPPTDGYAKEVLPLQVVVRGGEELTFAATGAVDYYGGMAAAVGPDGDPGGSAEIDSLGGISGYRGPAGALVGVFLDDANPRETTAPATLDFTPGGLSPWFGVLAPSLGQVFFIGNGTSAGDGRAAVTQEFTAPAGATRVVIGIADAFNFGGAPGAYDDNLGAFVVQVQRRVYTVSGTVTQSAGGALAGVTVSLGAGLTGVTDVNGVYSVAVPAGDYLATPSLATHTFAPGSRALSVPPSLTAVDFVATLVPDGYTLGGWVTAGGTPLSRIVVTEAGIGTTMTDDSGYYTFTGVSAGTYRVFPDPASGHVFSPPQRLVTVPPTVAYSVSFEAVPTGDGTRIPGPMAIYLAGRDDVTIPPAWVEPESVGFPLTRVCVGACMGYVAEQFPALVAATAGEHLQFHAMGAVAYFDNREDAAGPDGYSGSDGAIEALGGISAYNGPCGALVGVFLGAANPAAASAPPALDFTPAGLGTGFAALAPDLGQVFFIGDGSGANGAAQTFTVPTGATRLFIGTADAYAFSGAPGAYDDNVGAFAVTVSRVAAPVTHSVTYLAGPHGKLEGMVGQTVLDGGSTAPVNAVADWGYHFVDWSDGRTANPRQDTLVTSDLVVTANFAADGCVSHQADQNGDWSIQLSPELTRLIQFYNRGGYHCQAGTEDGYAPDAGATACGPHQADQNGDWVIQLSPELTRLIQFYNSDGYHCEAGTEDGYAPGRSAGKGAVKGGTLTAVRTLGARPERGARTHDVVVTLRHTAPAALTALALTEALPAGWSFAGVVAGTVPEVRPTPGARGTLEFAWVAVPAAWPVTFTYRVSLPLRAPPGSALVGKAYFREGAGEKEVSIGLDHAAPRLARVGAQEGAGTAADLSDLTGTYAATLGGQPLTLSLVQDADGRLSGVAAWAVPGASDAAATALTLAVQGRVRVAAGVPAVTLPMRGRAVPAGVVAALRWRLGRVAGAESLAGWVQGWVQTPLATAEVSQPALLSAGCAP